MKTSEFEPSARGYLCVGCDEPIDEKDGVFIYNRTDVDHPVWCGHVAHARPLCMAMMFVRYIQAYQDLNSLETAIALDKAVRDLRDAGQF